MQKGAMGLIKLAGFRPRPLAALRDASCPLAEYVPAMTNRYGITRRSRVDRLGRPVQRVRSYAAALLLISEP